MVSDYMLRICASPQKILPHAAIAYTHTHTYMHTHTTGIITFIFLAYCVQGFADPNMAISIFYAMITDVFAPEERTAMFGIISAGQCGDDCIILIHTTYKMLG